MTLSILAIQKARNNQWQEAVDINEQILAQDPTNVEALNRLALAYLQLGQLKQAKDIYNTVLKLDRFNPIAKRNLEKLKSLEQCGNGSTIATVKRFSFIEEHGKTKIVPLVRLGEPTVVSLLQACVELDMDIRSQSICFYYQKKYVGKLPDDVAKRLIWLYKRDNRYAAFVKSIDKNKLCVFIKETKRSLKNMNYHSFLSLEREDGDSYEQMTD